MLVALPGDEPELVVSAVAVSGELGVDVPRAGVVGARGSRRESFGVPGAEGAGVVGVPGVCPPGVVGAGGRQSQSHLPLRQTPIRRPPRYIEHVVDDSAAGASARTSTSRRRTAAGLGEDSNEAGVGGGRLRWVCHSSGDTSRPRPCDNRQPGDPRGPDALQVLGSCWTTPSIRCERPEWVSFRLPTWAPVRWRYARGLSLAGWVRFGLSLPFPASSNQIVDTPAVWLSMPPCGFTGRELTSPPASTSARWPFRKLFFDGGLR